ncbi:DUF1543 domain-containing protein [Alcaligenaceae bacterium C4P045]|nr:DUF1543 domain-containing protein [Alcaligenaceae bacterium C4P045]
MLFVVMLGGRHPRANIEVHDVVFTAAPSLPDAHALLKRQWFGDPGSVHIDSWMCVDGVDGFKVTFSDLPPDVEEPRLFFVNVGGYEQGIFGELHNYLLLPARSVKEAKSLAKRRLPSAWTMTHVDAVQDVDDCIPIEHINGKHVRLSPGAHSSIKYYSDYVVL